MKRSRCKIDHGVQSGTHEALVLCKEDGDASVDFADSERDKHVGLRGRMAAGLLLHHGCFASWSEKARPESN